MNEIELFGQVKGFKAAIEEIVSLVQQVDIERFSDVGLRTRMEEIRKICEEVETEEKTT